jgi:hypothetical protein
MGKICGATYSKISQVCGDTFEKQAEAISCPKIKLEMDRKGYLDDCILVCGRHSTGEKVDV